MYSLKTQSLAQWLIDLLHWVLFQNECKSCRILLTLPNGNFPNQNLQPFSAIPEQWACGSPQHVGGPVHNWLLPEAYVPLWTGSFSSGHRHRGWAGRKEAIKTMETYQRKSCGQGWLHELCSHTGPPAQDGPMLGLMLFCHQIILNDFFNMGLCIFFFHWALQIVWLILTVENSKVLRRPGCWMEHWKKVLFIGI